MTHMKMKALGLAVSLACLSPVVMAQPAKSVANPGAAGVGVLAETVTLMVKRTDLQSAYPWVRVEVPVTQVDERIRELMEDPSVVKVERAAPVSAPDPIPNPDDMVMNAMADAQMLGALYNDEFYSRQFVFKEGEAFNSQFEPAHRRVSFANPVRVGVVDSNFFFSEDLVYAGGANFRGERGSEFRVGEGGICVDENDQAVDQHGNWVAHIIGATTDNTIGMAAVSRNTSIVAGNALNCRGTGSTGDIVEAMLWLSGEPVFGVEPIQEPVDVINLSLGGLNPCSDFEQEAINFIVSKGIAIVASAGNDSDDADRFSPANCSSVVSVASVTRFGEVSNFSNTGSTVDIAAQGSSLPVVSSAGRLTFISGTSFSGPIVAGALAMVKSERPDTTPAMMAEYLSKSGKPLAVEATGMGVGILDAMLLLDAAGVPRERFGVESAVDGERARYAQALTHPNVDAYLSDRGAPRACDLVQVDSAPLALEESDDPLTVFAVPTGQPLTPVASNATILESVDAERVVLDRSRFAAGMDYGYARCDLVTGANCNQVDTIRGLDVSALPEPAVCEVPEVAIR